MARRPPPRGATVLQRWASALLLLCLAAPLAAQAPLAFRRFGLTEGLPQSQVQALMEDSHGFLWVGTNTGGIARLGTGSFKPYGVAQGVRARSIVDLMEDPSGGIWAASPDSGVSEIRGSEVRNYGPDEGLTTSQTFELSLDPQGRVLVGTRLGLFRQRERGFEAVPLPEPWGSVPIFGLDRDPKDGSLWLASRGGRVARWDGRVLDPHPLPAPYDKEGIITLKVDPRNGEPYALVASALLRLRNGAWSAVPVAGFKGEPKLRGMSIARSGEILASLGGDGLWLLEPDGSSRVLTQADGLPHASITSMLRDRRGVLWVGSDGDGLAAQVTPTLRSITGGGADEEGLGAVMGILELGRGDYLFAGSTGLYRWNEGKGVVGHWGRAQGMTSEESWSPLPDGAGGAWVGTSRGLVHWHPGGKVEPGPKELDLTAVVQLLRFKDHIWAGTENGLCELDAQGRYIGLYAPPPELGVREVFNLMVDGDRLLLGLRLGVYTFDAGRWTKLYPNAPFASQDINCMLRDARGALWVGTVEGLYEQRGEDWISRGARQGLPDDNVSFIAELSPGRMAIGHDKGLSILEDAASWRLTHNQGLLSDETNHNAVLKDSRGRLWIGMIGGVNLLEDAAAFHSESLPTPLVTEIRWTGGTEIYPSHLDLPPRPPSLQLSFDIGSPLVPDPPRYQAFMEGLDSAWRPASQGNALQYLNLPRGDYRFRLRASLDGIHWQEAAPLELHVKPAWHERWSVRALMALAGLGLLLGLVRLRVRRLELAARQLEDKVQARTETLAHQNRALEHAHEQIKRTLEGRLQLMDMVTHDLRSPLTSIMLSVDRLREGVEDPEEREVLMGVLDLETHRIEGMLRQVLDQSRNTQTFFQSVKLEPTSPLELLQGIEEVLRLKAADRGLSLLLEVSPETGQVQVEADPSAIQQVLLNLFENALKFTPVGGTVGIRSSVEARPGIWRLEVWDTGRGLDPQELDQLMKPFVQSKQEDASRGWGLGLSICLSLLELHGGELRVRSEPGKGANFIISLPLMVRSASGHHWVGQEFHP